MLYKWLETIAELWSHGQSIMKDSTSTNVHSVRNEDDTLLGLPVLERDDQMSDGRVIDHNQ